MLLPVVLQKLIFRRIPKTGLSEESTRENSLKKVSGSNQFVGWIKCRAQSFVHAGRGILLLCLTQWNFRIQLVAGLGATCLGWYFRITETEWLFLSGSITLVLCAEALNTVLERTVDLLKPDRHPVARDAKDLAAAGVLIASVGSLAVGLILFAPRLFRLLLRIA